MMKDLKKFYQAITKDSKLIQQFESITERKDFVNLAVQMGAERGYTFTDSEVLTSIEENTASGQGDYFCLPIGCWHNISFQ